MATLNTNNCVHGRRGMVTYVNKDVNLLQERPRPEYCAKAPTYEKNPVTGVKEPHFPPRKRLPRILSGIAVIIIMVR